MRVMETSWSERRWNWTEIRGVGAKALDPRAELMARDFCMAPEVSDETSGWEGRVIGGVRCSDGLSQVDSGGARDWTLNSIRTGGAASSPVQDEVLVTLTLKPSSSVNSFLVLSNQQAATHYQMKIHGQWPACVDSVSTIYSSMDYAHGPNYYAHGPTLREYHIRELIES